MKPKPNPAAPKTSAKKPSSPEARLAMARAMRKAAAEFNEPELVKSADRLEASVRGVTRPG